MSFKYSRCTHYLLVTLAFLSLFACRKDSGNPGLLSSSTDERDERFELVCAILDEPWYPGGHKAWSTYLQNNIHYPDEAIREGIEGTVIVLFEIGKDGHVRKAQADSGPAVLRSEAERVILESGKWDLEDSGFNLFPVFKKQPIIFRIEDEIEEETPMEN